MSRTSVRERTIDRTLGRRYKARHARDHFRDVLNAAEAGSTVVILRDRPVATVDAAILEELLAVAAPFRVLSSVSDDEVAFWTEDGLVHATGATMEEATEAFLVALVDYAAAWFDELRDAPNHEHNRLLALRIALNAGDHDAFVRAVFGES